MIFDCVMYRDEADMLQGRLREFEPMDVTTILVEAPVTHRGDPKPLWFAENADRFAPWKNRVVHVIANDLPVGCDPWVTEHAQRDAAIPALNELAADDDIVVIADVDEFWPQGFDFARVSPVVSFNQNLAMYAVDWLYPQLHCCTVAARWGALKGKSLAAVRDNRHAYPMVNGGWHLTWLGGLEGQRQKLAVTCHTEMTKLSKELLASGRCYREGIHHTGDFQMRRVEVDETWPRFIYDRRCPKNWLRPRSVS